MSFFSTNRKRYPPNRQLRKLLEKPGILQMPCCYDALSAMLIESAGFRLTFMSGFAVAAARCGLPDTGLLSYGEMVAQGRDVCSRVNIPVIGDADTGYGNEINVKRTIHGYSQAGFACAMIEDQIAPKRCGHMEGKAVLDRKDACRRLKAAVDARDEGADILILARTDARSTHGMDEAVARAKAFADLGADIIFLEAPESVEELERFCREVSGAKMANMLPKGKTPYLPASELEAMGFKIVAYPLDLLYSSIKAMQRTLSCLAADKEAGKVDFDELKTLLRLPEYNAELDLFQ